MRIKTIATGILLILFALLVTVRAMEIRTSEDSLSISSTEGKVFVYVKNTAKEDKDLHISVDGKRLNAHVEPYQELIRQGSTGGAMIEVSAPDCFRGSESITIYAQLCTDASCETASRKVTVYVEPAKHCETYIEGFAAKTQFVSGVSCSSSGCFNIDSLEPRQSRIVTTASFDVTDYNLRISGADSCPDVRRGEMARVRLTLANRGASGNFDLRVVTGSEANAFPSKDYVALQRSGSEEVFVDISPEKDAVAGRLYVTLQALHLDELISEKDVCIDLVDEFNSGLFAPNSFSIKEGNDATIQLEISNEGTKEQHYKVDAFSPDFQQHIIVIPSQFSLQPGGRRLVDVEIKTSNEPAGSYKLEFISSSEETEETAEMMLKIEPVTRVSESVDVDAESTEKENILMVDALIRNEEEYEMAGLKAEITGIPDGWKVSEIGQFSIKPNSEKRIEFEITMTSQEDASPVLVISKDGKQVGSQKLPKISGKAGGFTGLFALNAQNIILGAVILVALYLFFLVGRREETSGSSHSMESIKHEVEGGHGPHSHSGH